MWAVRRASLLAHGLQTDSVLWNFISSFQVLPAGSCRGCSGVWTEGCSWFVVFLLSHFGVDTYENYL
jgi:hypothetical protein